MEQNDKDILNYLFTCIVINIIPIMLLGEFNIPNKIYTILTILVYIVQILIMIWCTKNKIKNTSKKIIIFILVIFSLQIITQIVNFLNFRSIEIKDIVNIVAVILNSYLYIYMALKSEVTKEQFVNFMRKIVFLGMISCIYNIIVNFENVINIFNVKNSYELNLKSFFANRNQYGIFLIIVMLSNLYILNTERSKKYIILQIIFIISAILTMSRNAILGTIIMNLLFISFNIKNIKEKLSKKQMITFIAVCSTVVLIIVLSIVLVPEIKETVNKLFIRTYTISTDSGRIKMWINGIDMVKSNILTGIGRFKAIMLNNTAYNSRLDQFHSIYVETLVTYGIVGEVCLIYSIVQYIKRIKNSFIDKGEKNIMLIGIITFLIISCFETTCRLSIGYADTITMIYFITIPLMYTNIKLKEENKCHKVKE